MKSELATFFEAFPNATIWANTIDGQGYDMVFMGHLDPAKIDIDAIEAKLRTPGLHAGGRVDAGDRDAVGDGPVFDLCRAEGRPGTVGGRGGNEPRPRPAAAIYGRVGDQLAAGRPDLPGHAEVPAAERASVHGLAGNDGASARVYREYSLALINREPGSIGQPFLKSGMLGRRDSRRTVAAVAQIPGVQPAIDWVTVPGITGSLRTRLAALLPQLGEKHPVEDPLRQLFHREILVAGDVEVEELVAREYADPHGER